MTILHLSRTAAHGAPVVLALALGALCPSLRAQQAAAPAAASTDKDRVDVVRTALEQWVETRRAIARTSHDWQLDRERLGESLALVERDIQTLREKIAAAETGTAEADAKKVELAAKVAKLDAAAVAFQRVIGGLETRVRALLRRLPDPVRDKVAPLSQRIPENEEQAAKLDASKLSQRYLNVVGVLNEIDKWNREITVTNEVRTVGNGTSAEVTALYLGIGQGYYVSQNGEAAGIGMPGPDGWIWVARNDAAPAIKHAIEIARNEKVADFVLLPLQVK